MSFDLINYKKTINPFTYNQLIEYSNLSNEIKNENESDNDQYDIIEYFDLMLYSCLKSPSERLRYVVLYDFENKEEINNIRTKIIIDLEIIFSKDTYLFLKTLQKLLIYNVDFIPSNTEIHKCLYRLLQNQELTFEVKSIIISYFKKFGVLYSDFEINNLIQISFTQDNDCKTSIWSLILRLILFHGFVFQYKFLITINNLFWELKVLDKYLFIHIILAMLLSNIEKNKENIQRFFREKEEQIKEILIICSEGKNISIITTILYLIKDIDNYNYFKDILDQCIEKKQEQNLKVFILQE